MAAKAEAVAIVIDVSPSMNEAADGEETPLQKCITAANMIVQRKIFTDTKKNKDEVVLILFGTEGTENDLHAENGEGYEHITVVKELGVMDLEILKFINQQITAGTENGDFVDALVVALDHLHKKCMGRKMDQKIVLFSNLCCEFNGDDLDNIVNGMKGNNVNMIFVGPEIADEDDDDTGNDDAGPSNRNQGNSDKPLSRQQVQGVNCMSHILKEVDGDGVSINEILPMLSYFETRRKKQVTTFRGAIEIGNNLKINVYAYVKVKEERPASWKKLSALAEHAANRDTMGVEMQRSFHLNDEDQTEVDKDNTAQAFRYGKTLVPMTGDDQKSMKLQTTKGCIVLGFTSRDNVPRHLFTRDTCHIFTSQPEDEHAAVAFSALCHALEEKNMVAIVRYVSRGNTDPKIGFLSPHIKSSYESLLFIALPYREDIRTYMFSSLEGGKNKPVTEDQLTVVDSLIDSMFLVRKSLDDDNEEVEEELFKPRTILNPVNQRQCQCIQSRALDPDEMNIPNIEEYIERSIRARAEMVSGCEATYDRMKECFPLEHVETKKKAASSMFNKENEEPASKKPKEDQDDLTFGSLTRDQVTEVGFVNPLEDFKALLDSANNRNNNDEVLSQMSSVVMKLVKESFLDQHYPKAMQCMQALREQCVKLNIPKVFNDLLVLLREETYGKRRQDFWDRLTDGTYNPISKSEASASEFSDADSKNYFQASEEKPEATVEQSTVEEDADDLLDML